MEKFRHVIVSIKNFSAHPHTHNIFSLVSAPFRPRLVSSAERNFLNGSDEISSSDMMRGNSFHSFHFSPLG
jgi:hypothetical protein